MMRRGRLWMRRGRSGHHRVDTTRYPPYHHQQQEEDEQDQIFTDRLFGFRTKVTLVEEVRCRRKCSSLSSTAHCIIIHQLSTTTHISSHAPLVWHVMLRATRSVLDLEMGPLAAAAESLSVTSEMAMDSAVKVTWTVTTTLRPSMEPSSRPPVASLSDARQGRALRQTDLPSAGRSSIRRRLLDARRNEICHRIVAMITIILKKTV